MSYPFWKDAEKAYNDTGGSENLCAWANEAVGLFGSADVAMVQLEEHETSQIFPRTRCC